MKVAFNFPVVLAGTPKRTRSPKSIACLIAAEVEIREYGAVDAIPAFSMRDHYGRVSELVRVNGQLFKQLGPAFPLKTGSIDEIDIFLGHHMMTGGQPFMTARTRFGKAFEGRKILAVWPATTSEGRSRPLETFTVQHLHSLPKLEDTGAADIRAIELDQNHRAAQSTADNVISIDRQLFIRCNEPYAAFLDWRQTPAFDYRDENLDREHIDGRNFEPSLDCRYQSYWYFQAALSYQHVFPSSMKQMAIAFAEEVTTARQRKSNVHLSDGQIMTLGDEMTLQEAVDFDTARFAKQATVAAWVISRSLFDKKVKGTLALDVERAASAGEHLALLLKANLSANLLQESYFDVIDACDALRNRLNSETNQMVERVCKVAKVHKRRL
jgi:hypothetical protein